MSYCVRSLQVYMQYKQIRLEPVAQQGGASGDICSRAQNFGGAKLRSECYILITKCQISEDVNNCNLQNVECQRLLPNCEISSRSHRFAKRAAMNLSDVSRRSFYLQQKVPACSLTHGCITIFQKTKVAIFPTSLSFYSCVTTGRESSVHSACSVL